MMKPIRGIYAWYYQMIVHLNKPLGPLGKFSNPDSGARAFITILFGLPILVILDALLPGSLAHFPYLIGIGVMVLGMLFTKSLNNSRFRSDEFRTVTIWRDSQDDALLWLLEVVTFIITVTIYILFAYLWKVITNKP